MGVMDGVLGVTKGESSGVDGRVVEGIEGSSVAAASTTGSPTVLGGAG